MTQQFLVSKPFFNSSADNINYANLCVLGVPWDASSSFRQGATQGPEFIRHATSGDLYNSLTETGQNLRETWQIYAIGDFQINELPVNEAKNAVLNQIRKYNKYGMKFLFLGGDHLTTYFTFTSLKKIRDSRIGLIYLDAHPDLYDNYNGNNYSHACVVKRIIDETNIEPENIFQVGIRSPTKKQIDYANSINIKTITTKEFQAKGALAIAKQIQSQIPKYLEGVYVTIDLDVLDPAFAPGVGNPEPGGLTTREIIDFIHGLQDIRIYAFDVVELSPKFDYSGITAFAASKIIKEMLGVY